MIASFVVVGLAKPWGSSPPRPAPSAAPSVIAVAPARSRQPEATQPVSIDYLMEPVSMSLDDVRGALTGISRAGPAMLFVPGVGRSVIHVQPLRSVPTTQALGQTCLSAPVVPLGHEGFGLTVPAATATVTVARLFAAGSPLPVSTQVTLDTRHGLALISLRKTSWPVGHYTVVTTSGSGSISYLPFCVSSDVPGSADAPSARFELWDPAQP